MTIAPHNDVHPPEVAIFGGGCFWCLEAVYQKLKGVHQVMSGYMGGHVDHPSYEQVCGKQTGHIEVVRIVFDPRLIRYADLLDVFFEIHDPTSRDRQGNDVGPQYRSAIFALTPEHVEAARQAIDERNRASGSGAKIVTQLLDVSQPEVQSTTAGRFWPAEMEHHNYYERNPHQGYCAFVVAPKVEKARDKFRALIAQ